MNSRIEARERLAGRYEVRVLEPSPPAITDGPWFADDPVARGAQNAGVPLVSPVGTGDLRWEEVAEGNDALGGWCAERWLGPYRRLGRVPPQLVATRLSLHRLAEEVIAPARRHANGKFGLRYTRGGFGTPFFAADVQVRVQGTELIVDQDGQLRRTEITTLAAAAEHLGTELLPAGRELDRAPLQLDGSGAAFLGNWYGFAASVLEELRAESASHEPSRVQLWPEHFDVALELGREAEAARAAYGLSPGDAGHEEPYLYVAPWSAPAPGSLWQASGFTGAELAYAEILAAEDQRAAALAFFRDRLDALARPAPV
jgi:hypothetical protein